MLLLLSNSPYIKQPLIAYALNPELFQSFEQNVHELHIYFCYSYHLTWQRTTSPLCKAADWEMYRSPDCRSRWWLLWLCVNSLCCAAAVRECRESMGEAHTHPQLQARTDSQPLCSSAGQPTQSPAKPDSPTPTPTQDIPYLQLWAFTSLSFQLTFAISRPKHAPCVRGSSALWTCMCPLQPELLYSNPCAFGANVSCVWNKHWCVMQCWMNHQKRNNNFWIYFQQFMNKMDDQSIKEIFYIENNH